MRSVPQYSRWLPFVLVILISDLRSVRFYDVFSSIRTLKIHTRLTLLGSFTRLDAMTPLFVSVVSLHHYSKISLGTISFSC